MICIADFESYAKLHLPKKTLEFLNGGADEEQSLRRNVAAFSEYNIRPRILRNVSSRDLRCSIFGGRIELAFPIGVAPFGAQRMYDPDGELATARAASKRSTLMIASTVSGHSLEEIATEYRAHSKHGGMTLLWFQLYVFKDRQLTKTMVRRAENAGYKAIVFTVDHPVAGRRRANIRNQFDFPPEFQTGNLRNTEVGEYRRSAKTGVSGSGHAAFTDRFMDSSLTWEMLGWFRSFTNLPLILKGILTAEDAQIAVKNGVDAIVVSNHGGRQLDSTSATIDCLSEVVAAVAGKCEVFFDGGIRTGTDVFKALALGAKAVFLARPIAWGLSANGEAGAGSVLDVLCDEFDRTMALAGCRNLSEINSSFVQDRRSRSML